MVFLNILNLQPKTIWNIKYNASFFLQSVKHGFNDFKFTENAAEENMT